LIAALADANVDVAAEAGLSLCVLSRRPEGIGVPGSKGRLVPTEPPEPAENEDDAAHVKRIQAWQKAAHQAWHEWYLQARPYDERDDHFQLRSK
jgi:hypothetical protein